MALSPCCQLLGFHLLGCHVACPGRFNAVGDARVCFDGASRHLGPGHHKASLQEREVSIM